MMLRWYEDLYVDASVEDPVRIRKKLDRGRFVPGLYLVTLASAPANLLDIVPEGILKQKRIRNCLPVIVGIAMGKEKAVMLACSIVREVFERTGEFQVKRYFSENGRTE